MNLEAPYKEIQYLSTYRNPKDHPVEAVFHFPRNGDFIFHRFEAIFHNKTLVGKITTRGDNHTEPEPCSEVVKITVGELQANATVQILFVVIQPLKVVLNKFFELKFPAITSQESLFIFDQELKEWNIQVDITSKKPLTILSNPTHRFSPEKCQSTNSNKAFWNVTTTPDQDFTVYFAPERLSDIETLSVTHPDDPNDHIFQFAALPDMRFFSNAFVQNALQNASDDGMLTLQKAAFNHDQRIFPPQYIFMIDRSDSIKGARFETLKKALIDILQLLPERNEIEILSFGSTFEFYKIKGKYRYADGSPTVKEAIEYVKTLEADMGEKDLLKAMNAVNGHSWDLLYNRAVIILTDGEISFPDKIAELVGKDSRYVKTCTLGVGANEGSKSLLQEIANAGKCQSEFIGENEDLGEKAFHLMQSSVERFGFDLVSLFLCQDHSGEMVREDGCEACSLPPDIIVDSWFYLDNVPDIKSCRYIVEVYCEGREILYEKEGQISNFDNATITDTNFYHKIAYSDKLKSKEAKLKRGFYNSEFRDLNSIKQNVVDRSIKYQILSGFTQLVPVLQETIHPAHVTAQSNRNIQSFEL